MNIDSDFSNAKVGDTVWCIQRGKCTITSIIPDAGIAPILVAHKDFPNKNVAYNMDGKLFETDVAPSLFHKKPECFKTKVKKTVELKGYYDTVKGTFINSQAEPIPDKRYLSAKATITYEVEE